MLDRSAVRRAVAYDRMMIHVVVPEEIADSDTDDSDARAERFAGLLEARLPRAYPGVTVDIEVREGPPWEGSVMVHGAPEVEPPLSADAPHPLRGHGWREVWEAGAWR